MGSGIRTAMGDDSTMISWIYGDRFMKTFVLLALGVALSIKLFAVEEKDESLRNAFETNRPNLLITNANLKQIEGTESAEWFEEFLGACPRIS
jgi:hypothetical protein